jgi:hypothetical protein
MAAVMVRKHIMERRVFKVAGVARDKRRARELQQ